MEKWRNHMVGALRMGEKLGDRDLRGVTPDHEQKGGKGSRKPKNRVQVLTVHYCERGGGSFRLGVFVLLVNVKEVEGCCH